MIDVNCRCEDSRTGLELRRFFVHSFGQVLLGVWLGVHELIDPNDNVCVLTHEDPDLHWGFFLYSPGNFTSHIILLVYRGVAVNEILQRRPNLPSNR